MTTLVLPDPELTKGRFASISAYSDEALYATTGVRIAFTTREGGVSEGPYASLNLGSHVKDDLANVQENRRRVQQAFACEDAPLFVPNQVHGDVVLGLGDPENIDAPLTPDQARELALQAQDGADGLVVHASNTAALLCYADCVPVIIVSPTGRFAVVHAGWRGVDNLISVKAVRSMAYADEALLGANAASTYNVYIGPHIGPECFETGADVHARFVSQFGEACAFDGSHIDLAEGIRIQLDQAGVSRSRICDLAKCTVCENREFFSYRGQGGTCGRHGAFAVRTR